MQRITYIIDIIKNIDKPIYNLISFRINFSSRMNTGSKRIEYGCRKVDNA